MIGIDASEGYLEGARRDRSHPNISYEHGDMHRMRFSDDQFDAAVSTLALDVVPEIEPVVAEMKRVMPGSKATSRAKGSHRKLGGLVSGRQMLRERDGPHREGEERAARLAAILVGESPTSIGVQSML